MVEPAVAHDFAVAIISLQFLYDCAFFSSHSKCSFRIDLWYLVLIQDPMDNIPFQDLVGIVSLSQTRFRKRRRIQCKLAETMEFLLILVVGWDNAA